MFKEKFDFLLCMERFLTILLLGLIMRGGKALGSEVISGTAYYGPITKQLLHTVPPGAIIIIEHEDIDITAAQDMLRKKVKTVINTRTSVTGKLSRSGVSYLLSAGVSVFDTVDDFVPEEHKSEIKIKGTSIRLKLGEKWRLSGRVKRYTEDNLAALLQRGKSQFPELYASFAENSFSYARKEIDLFLSAVKQLPKLEEADNACVFIVGRGKDVENDIQYLFPCINKKDSVIFAIDGASEILYRNGIKPDYIIGDMDSVPEESWRYTGKFIAHSYMNGHSPGKERLQKLSIDSLAIPFPGLSEDLAVMLAFVSEAEHIILLGCKSSAVEMAEKGREGMGSTILTRMYAGDKISEWKNLSSWMKDMPMYSERWNISHTGLLKEYIKNDNSRHNHSGI